MFTIANTMIDEWLATQRKRASKEPSMKKMINNFIGKDPIEVQAADWVHARELGGIVLVLQDAGSMRLQHTMTASQAREMSAALLEAADEAEAIVEMRAI